MDRVPAEELVAFPTVGSRARVLKRFERDLAAWLDTAEGQFAVYTARAVVAADEQPAERR
jgi:hypothetical protein